MPPCIVGMFCMPAPAIRPGEARDTRHRRRGAGFRAVAALRNGSGREIGVELPTNNHDVSPSSGTTSVSAIPASCWVMRTMRQQLIHCASTLGVMSR